MGGNGSYSKALGGVPEASRSHSDTNYRISGHKILVQKENPQQNKVPMNSNSESPLYLCGKVDEKSHVVSVNQIGIYQKHKIVEVIDLKFDKNGDYIRYSSNGRTSHMHKWNDNGGKIGRKTHDKTNTYPIPEKYQVLIEKIVEFNKSKRKWNE